MAARYAGADNSHREHADIHEISGIVFIPDNSHREIYPNENKGRYQRHGDGGSIGSMVGYSHGELVDPARARQQGAQDHEISEIPSDLGRELHR